MPLTQEDYVDLQDKHNLPLTPDQKLIIKNNPQGLTKEGILKKIEQWDQSSNQYQKKFYRVMLDECKFITPSQTLPDGSVVLGKRPQITDKDGNIHPPKIWWVDRENQVIKVNPKTEATNGS